jgi:hypothetical protein
MTRLACFAWPYFGEAKSNANGNGKGQKGGDVDNDDDSLMRFEFIRVIIRIAIAKYGRGAMPTWDVSSAVEHLVRSPST